MGCEICGAHDTLGNVKGHMLCPYCSLRACPRCWKDYPVERPSLFGLRWRLVCPGCGWRGGWHG